MKKIRFEGGRMGWVIEILKLCGMPEKEIRFSRVVLISGEFIFELSVPDRVKVYLDILNRKAERTV